MPWQATDPVDQRERFIADHRHGLYAMVELCARYGVSRKTGYKWLARYDAGGRPALRERSHAPHHCPQQNGAHERMHRTLKAEATRPPRGSLGAQQRAFNAFRRLHNAERPHAALGGLTPASQYRPSPRPYPARLPPLEYPGHYLVKRVTNAGTFRFRDRLLFIAHALKQHHVGLEETGDGVWSIHLGPVPLTRLDERDYVFRG